MISPIKLLQLLRGGEPSEHELIASLEPLAATPSPGFAAMLNRPSGLYKDTPLFVALQHKSSARIVALLIQTGSDPTSLDASGKAPIQRMLGQDPQKTGPGYTEADCVLFLEAIEGNPAFVAKMAALRNPENGQSLILGELRRAADVRPSILSALLRIFSVDGWAHLRAPDFSDESALSLMISMSKNTPALFQLLNRLVGDPSFDPNLSPVTSRSLSLLAIAPSLEIFQALMNSRCDPRQISADGSTIILQSLMAISTEFTPMELSLLVCLSLIFFYYFFFVEIIFFFIH